MSLPSPTPSADAAMSIHAPAHPVPQLQGPFEESMLEAVNEIVEQEIYLDAAERRATLLERPHYERVCAGRWKQKPGERYHPLWKIAAQTSFGMHLLAESMAKSEDEVMKILQSHVDDVDGFLERTTEDFDLALSDVQERLRYLMLPLEHIEVFDRMLEDRAFRASIVEGNEKIEHIVDRTSKSIRDSMKDVQKGLDATRALGRYLDDLAPTWDRQAAEHEAVFIAMQGNVEGWGRAFMDLHLQGNRIKVILVELSETVSEMMRRAGIVSRKNVRRTPVGATVTPQMTTRSTNQSKPRTSRLEATPSSKAVSRSSTHKALPSAPGADRHTRSFEKRAPQDNKQAPTATHTARSVPKSKHSPNSASGLIPAESTDQGDFYARPFSPSSFGSKPETPSSVKGTLHQPSREQLASPHKPLTKRTQAIELPADVPHAVLLQAPLSKENRRSLNLAPKPPDTSDPRTSRKLSNKVLASLLRSPLSTRLSRLPQSVNSGKINEFYTNASDSPSGHTAEYFSAADVGRTVLAEEKNIAGLKSSNEKAPNGLGILSHSNGVSYPSRQPGLLSPAQSPGSQTSDKRRPANPLASHPPGVGMFSSPHAQQGSFPSQSASSSIKKSISPRHGRFPSLAASSAAASSLGEPGPEIDEFEPFDLVRIMQASEHAKQFAGPSPVPAVSYTSPASDNQPTSVVAPEFPHLMTAENRPNPAVVNAPSFIAELDGAAVVSIAITPKAEEEKSLSPVELEAPELRTYILPPRSFAVSEAKVDVGTTTSATIASQSDFFKMPPPTVGQEKESENSSKARSVMVSGGQSQLSSRSESPSGSIQPDRSSPPSRMLGRSIPRKTGKPAVARMAQLQTEDIIEKLSSTPPGSPIHTRSPSEMSANSAQRLSGQRIRASSTSNPHPLGPPIEAPAPPGPGGRQMARPDYASEGMYEGEKKRSSRGSSGNQAGWKKFFGGASQSPFGSIAPSSTSGASYFETKESKAEAEAAPVSNTTSPSLLDTATGKDVLWFQGMSRDGVWVSTASGTN